MPNRFPPAYTGYRRSIGDVLETTTGTTSVTSPAVTNTTATSNPNESQISNNVELENSNLKTTTATIYTQNTSQPSPPLPQAQAQVQSQPIGAANSSDAFIKNEIKQSQQEKPATAPKPAPRTRVSSQNSVPLTNGDGKADEIQVGRISFVNLGESGLPDSSHLA